ncbi:hypothetical protein [Streptomyces sp. NPDC057686]
MATAMFERFPTRRIVLAGASLALVGGQVDKQTIKDQLKAKLGK